MSLLIVIGYDGSEEAGHAIDAAVVILRATDAAIVTVWASPVAPSRGMITPADDEHLDAGRRVQALRTADEGVAWVAAGGLVGTHGRALRC